MKQIRKNGIRHLEVCDVEEPKIRALDDIKIKVSYATVCTNDLMIWNGSFSNPYANNGIGHEFSGVITDLGEDASLAGFSVGDRVSGLSWNFCGKCPYCRAGKENLCVNMSSFVGAMSEYIVIKDKMTCKLPDSVPLDEGCLTEVVSLCLHGMDRVDISHGNTVLLFGGGVSGQLMVQLAKMRGASNIVLCDRWKSKRMLALELGASQVLDSSQEDLFEELNIIAAPTGFDVIINISHDPSIVSSLPSLIARGGKILQFTQYKPTETGTFNLAELYVKECSIVTSYLAPYGLDTAMKMLPLLNLKSLIGQVFKMEDAQKAFETYSKNIYPRVLIKIS